MYVRYCLSAFATEARSRRPARITRESAPRAAKEGADDCLQRGRWQSDDRRTVSAGYDSVQRIADGDRVRSAGRTNPKHNAGARQFHPRGTDSKIAPSREPRVTARDLSLARCRAPESADLV